MSDYCRRNGVSLAPHGKTTMCPELFALQLRDGAWAITAANVHQARVMRDSGVPRVLIANEVTAPGDIAWLATQVDADFPIVCYVDSIAGVHLLQEGLARHGVTGRLGVLIELGVVGGRTGARSTEEAVLVARAAAASPVLRVAGVSGFEGIIGPADGMSAETRVDVFLSRLVELAEAIIDEGLATDGDEFVVSAGGSVFFDRVVAILKQVRSPMPVRVVVRSGCYLSHDDGVIDELSPLGAQPRVDGDVLHAALEVWAPVLSRPEPTRLIVGAGKRDVSTDGLFPVAKKWVRRGSREVRPFDARPACGESRRSARVPRRRPDVRGRSRGLRRLRHLPPVYDVRQVAGDLDRRRRLRRRRHRRHPVLKAASAAVELVVAASGSNGNIGRRRCRYCRADRSALVQPGELSRIISAAIGSKARSR